MSKSTTPHGTRVTREIIARREHLAAIERHARWAAGFLVDTGHLRPRSLAPAGLAALPPGAPLGALIAEEHRLRSRSVDLAQVFKPWCNTCGESVDAAVELGDVYDGEDDRVTLCAACLRALLAIAEGA